MSHAHAVLDRAAQRKVLQEASAELWVRLSEYYQARALLEYASGGFRRAIKLQTEANGQEHKSLVPMYEQLARVYRQRGKLDDARAAYEQALSLLLKNRSQE